MSYLSVTIEALDIAEPSPILTFTGRFAWALMKLHQAGKDGVTPLDTPGPRWSAYVHNLRRAGLDIETIHEPHCGPYPGTHARYVLRSEISILTAIGPVQEAA